MPHKPNKETVLRMALRFAILYEESYIDSLRGCTDPSDVAAYDASKQNIARFQQLLDKDRIV